MKFNTKAIKEILTRTNQDEIDIFQHRSDNSLMIEFTEVVAGTIVTSTIELKGVEDE